ARLACLAVCSGRRLCGQEKVGEVLSQRAQHRYGFTVCPLPQASGGLLGDVFAEALADNTQTSPDEQVAFRIDFPAWLLTRTDRDRRMIEDLLRGEKAQDVGRKHGLSPGRVSQIRRALHDDWERFCGAEVNTDQASV